MIYIKPEDEVFHEHCFWSFSFHIHSQRVQERAKRDGLRALRLCMFIRQEKIDMIRAKIEKL